ncbi:hypothetical protein TNCV_5136091 [Trichonephila clavipes]|nr:hypothetical protein TNCV_5136091 [Trichonephila clavipes]
MRRPVGVSNTQDVSSCSVTMEVLTRAFRICASRIMQTGDRRRKLHLRDLLQKEEVLWSDYCAAINRRRKFRWRVGFPDCLNLLCGVVKTVFA